MTEWISDRLPEKTGNYLVTYTDGTVYNHYFRNGVWENNFFNRRIDIHGKVIAWMPFPLPPNHESSDGQWIPTSEKYPEHNGDYIVSQKGINSFRIYYADRYGWGDDWKQLCDKSFVDFWREMPEPFGKVKEDEA